MNKGDFKRVAKIIDEIKKWEVTDAVKVKKILVVRSLFWATKEMTVSPELSAKILLVIDEHIKELKAELKDLGLDYEN
ncbi:hypothetical protein AB3331_04670 [Streptococcus sp. H49]|uniref:hypothetical protein n=1 Tax=Streptococcus huangxiaojuni TaxID=3237239 RepID=UPI0034A2B2F3